MLAKTVPTVRNDTEIFSVHVLYTVIFKNAIMHLAQIFFQKISLAASNSASRKALQCQNPLQIFYFFHCIFQIWIFHFMELSLICYPGIFWI